MGLEARERERESEFQSEKGFCTIASLNSHQGNGNYNHEELNSSNKTEVESRISPWELPDENSAWLMP